MIGSTIMLMRLLLVLTNETMRLCSEICKLEYINIYKFFMRHSISTNMSQIQKLTSEKGKPMIFHEGFVYTLERTTETKLIFRCQNRNCKDKSIWSGCGPGCGCGSL